MTIKSLAIFSVMGLLCACSSHTGHPLHLDSVDNMAPIAALFETRVEENVHHMPRGEAKTHSWRFWRSANRIETLDLQDASGEAWFKSPDRQISYERIFHADREVIEYTPGDLKALGGEPDWLALSGLVDPRQAGGLRAEGSVSVLGRQAIRYRGETKDGRLELWWLEREQLPAMIQQVSSERTQTTVLNEIHALSESPWPPERRGAYRYTDYADIGDKENDPFVKSVLHRIKGGHAH